MLPAMLLALAGAWFLIVALRTRQAVAVRRRLQEIERPAELSSTTLPGRPDFLPAGKMGRDVAFALSLAKKPSAAPVLALVLMAVFLGNLMYGWLMAGSLAAIFVFLFVAFVRIVGNRKIERLLSDLPALIDNMRNAVTAGHSLSSAFVRAYDHSGAASRELFAPTIGRMNLGDSLVDALQQRADALRISELWMFVMILQMNERFGGNVTESLGNLVEVLRNRERVKKEFSASSAEVRTSANVLLALPLILVAVILVTQPGHLVYFVETDNGRALGGVVAAMLLTGAVVIRRLSRASY